ncbi:MAG: ADP-ribosylglycohydrolase family protein [Clostridia bacterium]|nr:ADP-ribosylglycohydrolase family protein [Clostridia bacterium]
MNLNFETYCDKVKACWIGKNIGGTMGAPYEGRRQLLDVKGFATSPGEPLPNDDLDLQLVWLMALENVGLKNINAATLGEFWLSYIVPYWNEYGIGKINMQRGLLPPLSGDHDNDWSSSNGAWIRTEIWACTAPALPEVAVKNACEDAKVDHGAGEGTYAAAFVAAMQSCAFVLDDLYQCIEMGLLSIPESSRVAKSVKHVIECYREGKSWQEARNTVLEMNADIGNGWFEAPSNVAYAVIGLVYGEGDFKKSMLTAINCGDDTDCTAATVGATLGILGGTASIPTDWSEYIGDKIITVSLLRAGIGVHFPKTCSELTKRVIDVVPAVLSAHNTEYEFRGSVWTHTKFGDTSENGNVVDELQKRIKKWVVPMTHSLRRNLMHFEEKFLSADVVLSEVDIIPGSEVNVEVDVSYNIPYDIRQCAISMRWILPEGFTVTGKQNAMIKRRWEAEGHGTGHTVLNYTIKAPEAVAPTNRMILEITTPARPTALYASFVLLG